MAEEVKPAIKEGKLPSIVGAALTVRHLGAIFAELRDLEGKVKAEYPYLAAVKIWDVSVTDIKPAGDVDFKAVKPRVLLAYHDTREGVLYVVETEYE